jgi:esterase
MNIDTSVADREITLDGIAFHYREWGAPSSPPLVILHGVSSHARTWGTFARAFCGRYHIFALDQRGHGESGWADDYSPERRVEDLAAFVDALGLERFVLVGLSMGGICAYGYAPGHAERLDKLVIVDIAPELETGGMRRIGTALATPAEFDDPEEAVAFSRAANPRPPESELRNRVLHNLIQRDDGKWIFRYDPRVSGVTRARRADPEPVWASFAKITCPTLLVRGAESDLLGRAAAERMTREIPDCRLVEVPNAGHSVPLDNPQGFIEAVGTFL